MAPTLQLEGRPGGIIKRQLVLDIRQYVAESQSYARKYQDHKGEFGSVGLDKIRVPQQPPMMRTPFS